MSYKTSEVAAKIGIHPNTVRLYESLGFISSPERLKNGYRVYEELHIRQLRFARALMRGEVLQRGLRKKALATIKLFAARELEKARLSLDEYAKMLSREIVSAKTAAAAADSVLRGNIISGGESLKRNDTAAMLNVTVDALRTWEMNGLIAIKRMENGYRVYSPSDLQRLRLIKTLRFAGYSQTAILRLLSDPMADAQTMLNTPRADEEIVSVCDKLIVSLETALRDVEEAAKELKPSI